MNPGIQDILILELMLSSGEGVFYRERGESRVASRLTYFSESEEDLSSDDPFLLSFSTQFFFFFFGWKQEKEQHPNSYLIP